MTNLSRDLTFNHSICSFLPKNTERCCVPVPGDAFSVVNEKRVWHMLTKVVFTDDLVFFFYADFRKCHSEGEGEACENMYK